MNSAVEARTAAHIEMRPLSKDYDGFTRETELQRARCSAMPKPDYGDQIPDRDFLEVIGRLTQQTDDEPNLWVTIWELEDAFGASEEAIRAKAKDLNERELIYGCDCGCRGDWSLDDAGLYERPSIDALLERAA
jgi:hypothetical protein